MKKKKLKSISLKRTVISRFAAQSIEGGGGSGGASGCLDYTDGPFTSDQVCPPTDGPCATEG